MDSFILVFLIGILAGAMNAVAGGGSFITFPTLIYAGVPPISANASSTVALFPASLASAWEYKEYISPFPKVSMWAMIILTLLGGCAGALLLLYTPDAGFKNIVPWLLLTGSLVFAFGRPVGQYLGSKFRIGSAVVLSGQFLLGIYGGYFGGAVGLMMMAVWSLFGLSDIKVINANKTLFVGLANSVAVIIFILAGKIAWPETTTMLAATVCGGFAGAKYAKNLNPIKLRAGIVAFNFIITVVFFIQTYVG